jgi:hypothetical protein
MSCTMNAPPSTSGKEREEAMARAGWHCLQIPGPTNVPDRVLWAMDRPTSDHRGPTFAEIGTGAMAIMERVFRTQEGKITGPFCVEIDKGPSTRP